MSEVNYKEINQRKGEVIQTYVGQACYSKVFREVEKKTDALLLYEPKLYIKGGVEKLKEWVADVNRMGFPCEYLGYRECLEYDIEDPYHLFLLDLNKYKYKDHMASTLTLLRYTFERGLEKIVDAYFEVKSKYPRIKLLDALKISNILFSDVGNGHTLFLYPEFCNYTRKELMKSLKSGLKIRERDYTRLHAKWKSDKKLGFPIKTIENIKRKMNKKERLVYVVGGDLGYANWLPEFKTTNRLEDADLVMFTGGEDVHPSLYNEPVGKRTYSNLTRDNKEKDIYEKAKDLGIKMIGICRGSQFLCVMQGGKLVQHQENPSYIHKIKLDDGSEMHITSTHHQAAYPYNLNSWGYRIIGYTENISKIHLDGKEKELNPSKECEIVYYRNFPKCLGIQGHPEYKDWQEQYPESLEKLRGILEEFLNDTL